MHTSEDVVLEKTFSKNSSEAAFIIAALIGDGLRVLQLSDYYYGLIKSGKIYYGARSGFSVRANTVPVATQHRDMADPAIRYKVPAMTMQYYNTNRKKLLGLGLTKEEYLSFGISAWTEYLDSAVNTGGWAVYLFHTVTLEGQEPNQYSVYQEQLEALIDYTASYGDRVWVATYTDAQIYYNQWSSAKVTATRGEDVIKLNLTHGEKGEGYDMAMTVRLNVSDEWNAVTVNGERLNVIHENGESYVLVDVTPFVELTVYRYNQDASGDNNGDFEYLPVD